MKTLKDIGEFGLIKEISRSINTDNTVVKGIGDDCAVLEFTGRHYLLVTSDMIIENVHFKRSAPAFYIGRKALAAALSDIAAMGGFPTACVVSVGFPRELPVRFVKEIYRGIKALAKKYNVNVVGGDSNASSRIIIDVTCLGLVEKGNLTLRGGAEIGDIIFVTATLGGSIRGKHLKFEPRIKEARFLVKNFKINAMIDISDGLLQDLSHIITQSKVGTVIYEELIPVSKAASGLRDALMMGEDYELLFTTPVSEARRIIRKVKGKLLEIGEITDRRYGLSLITKDCRQVRLKPQGFSHF